MAGELVEELVDDGAMKTVFTLVVTVATDGLRMVVVLWTVDTVGTEELLDDDLVMVVVL